MYKGITENSENLIFRKNNLVIPEEEFYGQTDGWIMPVPWQYM